MGEVISKPVDSTLDALRPTGELQKRSHEAEKLKSRKKCLESHPDQRTILESLRLSSPTGFARAQWPSFSWIGYGVKLVHSASAELWDITGSKAGVSGSGRGRPRTRFGQSILAQTPTPSFRGHLQVVSFIHEYVKHPLTVYPLPTCGQSS